MATPPSRQARPGARPPLPSPPEGLLDDTTFDLTPDEAATCRQSCTSARQLAARLVARAARERPAASRPWQHPCVGELPDELGRSVDARAVPAPRRGTAHPCSTTSCSPSSPSATTWSSLPRRPRRLGEELAEHRVFDGWSAPELLGRRARPQPSTGVSTQTFVERWFSLVESGEHRGDAPHAGADRELRLKGRRSAWFSTPRRARPWTPGAGTDGWAIDGVSRAASWPTSTTVCPR